MPPYSARFCLCDTFGRSKPCHLFLSTIDRFYLCDFLPYFALQPIALKVRASAKCVNVSLKKTLPCFLSHLCASNGTTCVLPYQDPLDYQIAKYTRRNERSRTGAVIVVCAWNQVRRSCVLSCFLSPPGFLLDWNDFPVLIGLARVFSCIWSSAY